MKLMSTDNVYQWGWPRNVVDLWLKNKQFCIVEFSQDQFDLILAKGKEDAKKELHFCQKGDMWYAGVDPHTLQAIMKLSPVKTVAESVTIAATHSMGELLLLKIASLK